MKAADVKQAANGRWRGLLPTLGVSANYLVNKGGPCPICQEGKDRFRFDDKDGDGTWFCSHCGAGDGIALVQKINRYSFRETLEAISNRVGGVQADPPAPKVDASRVRDQMKAISKKRRPMQAVQAVSMWWVNRVGHVPECADLWGLDRLGYQDGRDGERSEHPAMIALVRDAEGKPVNLHRTYLAADGRKAAVPKPRKVMPIDLPMGAAIRLFSFTDVIGIAEGIETAVAATVITGIPCWACLNTTLMKGWVPPAGVHVVIFADHDPEKNGRRAGREAAQALAGRLLVDGYTVEVRTPEHEGDDWNDVLLRMKSKAAA